MITGDKLKDIFQYLLAFITIGGWLYLLNRLFISPVPLDNEKFASILFGALSMNVGMVYSYFFGSNKESAAKTQMIYESTPTKVVSSIPSDGTTTTTTTII